MAKDSEFYVSNKLLYEEYLKWYALIEVALEEQIEEPGIPDFIVDAMMKISSRLSYKPNFINYSFKEDMISDALYDCVRFAKKFKLMYIDKSGIQCKGNPFSYITTICFNAFLRRIDKEKTQRYIKAKIVTECADHDFLDNQSHDEDAHYVNQYVEFLKETGYSEDSLPMSIKRSKKHKNTQLELAGPLSDFEVIIDE